MGFIDDLAQQLLAGKQGSLSSDQTASLVRGVLDALDDDDEAGIPGLTRRLTSAGLGDVVSSWIGTGANRAVSPSDLARALSGSRLEQATQRAGLSGLAGAAALAGILPALIDKLTPGGKVPQRQELQQMRTEILGTGGLSPGNVARAVERQGGGATAPRPKADFSDVQAGASSSAPAAEPAQRTYTVVAGDSLSKIAKRFYGDANQWRRIFEANRDKIQNPDLIHPGQVLNIPEA